MVPERGNPPVSDAFRSDAFNGAQYATGAMVSRANDPGQYVPPRPESADEAAKAADRRDRELAARLGFAGEIDHLKQGLRDRDDGMPPLRAPAPRLPEAQQRRVETPVQEARRGNGADGELVARLTVRTTACGWLPRAECFACMTLLLTALVSLASVPQQGIKGDGTRAPQQ